MVSRSKKLKSRMKSGASASMQRSASRPMESSASMSMRMGSSHLCSWHLLTLSQAHSVSALASRLAGRCGLGEGTRAVAVRAAVASLKAQLEPPFGIENRARFSQRALIVAPSGCRAALPPWAGPNASQQRPGSVACTRSRCSKTTNSAHSASGIFQPRTGFDQMSGISKF